MCAAWQLPEDPSGQSFCIHLQGDESCDDSSSSAHGRQRWFFWARTHTDKLRLSKLVALLKSPPSLATLSGVQIVPQKAAHGGRRCVLWGSRVCAPDRSNDHACKTLTTVMPLSSNLPSQASTLHDSQEHFKLISDFSSVSSRCTAGKAGRSCRLGQQSLQRPCQQRCLHQTKFRDQQH